MAFAFRSVARASLPVQGVRSSPFRTFVRTLGNTVVTLKKRPDVNKAVTVEDFATSVSERDFEKDDIVARTLYLSVDPYMRCRFNSDTGVDYVRPFEVGSPITSAAISEVVSVRAGAETSLRRGDIVLEWFDSWEWKEYSSLSVEASKGLKVLPAAVAALIPLTYFLGGVGQTGLSAYFGILGETSPKPSDTIIISGAAGAVGTVVGQLAKQKGSYVVGICGSDEKGQSLTSNLGFDSAVNYKSTTLEQDLEKALQGRQASVYFDNVGGSLSDMVISQFMEANSQVIICGQIDMYNTSKAYPPPLGEQAEQVRLQLDIKRDRYLVFNYEKEFTRALRELLVLAASGKLKLVETHENGLENAPKAFCDMMSGRNNGKMLVTCVANDQLPTKLRLFNALRKVLPAFVKQYVARSISL